MKYVGVVVMVALALTVFYLPDPVSESSEDAPAMVVPPVAMCPLVQAGDRGTSVSVISSVNGPGRLSAYAAGIVVGEAGFSTGASGSVTIPATEVGVVGDAGGLVEMPSETTAAGVVVSGPTSLAAETCDDIVTQHSFVFGGSTADGAQFQLQILNPFAGDAVVDLTVVTDAGIESDERFDAVLVPASSTKTLDFGDLVPGRAFIAVDLVTAQGAVLAVGRQVVGDEVALWRAVEPALDWWLPVPPGGETKDLVLSTPQGTEVTYQIDFYGPEGLVEEYRSGELAPRGVARIPLTDDTTEAAGIHVISTGPVVATLWIESDVGLAATTASPIDAVTWLLPGASAPAGGKAAAVIFNSGLDPATVRVRALRDDAFARDYEVQPEATIVVNLVNADGYRVESTGPVVALWVSTASASSTAAIGFAIDDE